MGRLLDRSVPERLGLAVGLSLFLLVLLLDGLGRLQGLENTLLGVRYELRGPRDPAAEVVLIPFEEGSIFAGEGALPWSRQGLAGVVARLDQAGAAVIGLDLPALAGGVIPPLRPGEDRMLAAAMKAHGGVVLPMVIRETASAAPPSDAANRFALGPGRLPRPAHLRPGHLAVPSRTLCEAAAGLGTTNIYPDLDGSTIEAPLAASWGSTIYPSFWLELVRVLEGLPPGAAEMAEGEVRVGPRSYAVDPQAEILINYVGKYRQFPRLPYHSATEMPLANLRSVVEGRIVLVGNDLAGVTSMLRTPTSPLMPGVEIAATVTENLAAATMLRRAPAWLVWVATLVLVLCAGWMTARASPLGGVFMTLILLGVTAVAGLALFMVGVYVAVVPALLAVALTGGTLTVTSAAEAERHRTEAEGRLQSRLQAIAGIGRLVNSSLDDEQLLVEILRWAESEINAEACSLLLMEPDGETLRFEVALGEKGHMLKDIRLRVGEGLAGTAAATREPIVADDVTGDERWSRDVAYAIDYETESIACVPMVLRDEVLGVIEVINKRGGRFGDYDIQLLQVIAHQSALFLENARLYRALSEKVDLANEELRQANERLQFEMARIATLVDEMGDAVVATDEADQVVIFNNAAERIFGIKESEARGRQAVTVFDHPELARLFGMPLSPHGGSYETEITLDGAQPLVVRAQIALIEQPGQAEVGKCAVFSDITHLKELDRMKTDLISFVSHELKNPISSLQGACRLLHDRLDVEDPRTGRLLEIASRQGRRMQHLVQGFLDLSRIEAGHPLELNWEEVTDLRGLIGEVMSLIRGMGSEHHLHAEVDEDLPAFWADREKLEAVLINLIDNAVKYSPDGGDVTVRALLRDERVMIEVEDEGVGIREEDLPKLFKSFQRIHDSTYGRVSGTGVGLYICKHIIEAHGGDITVESTWGEGSIFRLHIPLREAPPEGAADR
ncbi:MAG: CHASE2 domain-containing protein [Armatimonadota bacterium]|nr:CHASE2 domain-containing protein [Armatimonadota bacterium]